MRLCRGGRSKTRHNLSRHVVNHEDGRHNNPGATKPDVSVAFTVEKKGGAYLGIIHRVKRVQASFCPMLSNPEQYSRTPVTVSWVSPEETQEATHNTAQSC